MRVRYVFTSHISDVMIGTELPEVMSRVMYTGVWRLEILRGKSSRLHTESLIWGRY